MIPSCLTLPFAMVFACLCLASSLLPSVRLGRVYNKISIASFSSQHYQYRSNANPNRRESGSRSRLNDKNRELVMPTKPFGKRKMAIVCGYIGSNYRGLQIDTSDNNFTTVEGEMIKALLAAGFVSESNAVDLSKIGWSRSSRTDKGVHASRIVLSMKLVVDSNFDQKVHSQQYADRINNYLKEDIRVFSVTKVNQGFRAREAGSWREYEYVLPLSVIDGKLDEFNRILSKYEGSKSFHNFHRVQRKNLIGAKVRQISSDSNNGEDIEEGSVDDDHEAKQARKQQRTERRAQGLINSVFEDWELMERVQGSVTQKNIYACRVISVVNTNGIDMVRIKVKGQSFLLHQIRLMLGAAIMVCTNRMPEAAINAALATPYFIAFPMAPSNGLILRNAGFGMNCNKVDLAMTADDARETQVDQILLLENQQEASDDFLREKIYDRIQSEWVEGDMAISSDWLEYNTERYKVDEKLQCKFEKLTNDCNQQYQIHLANLRERDLNSARECIENGLDRNEFVSGMLSHKMMLPQSVATDLALKLNTVPSMVLTKALRCLAVEVVEGKLPHGMTSEEVLKILGDMEQVKSYAAKFDEMYDEVMDAIKKEKIAAKKKKQLKTYAKGKHKMFDAGID